MRLPDKTLIRVATVVSDLLHIGQNFRMSIFYETPAERCLPRDKAVKGRRPVRGVSGDLNTNIPVR